MYSMTGFGSATGKTTNSTIEILVKSVNGRFLETRINLPSEYDIYESEFKKIISKHVRRGSVTVQVNRRYKNEKAAVEVYANLKLAQKLIAARNQIQKKFKLQSNSSIDSLLRHSEIITVENQRQNQTSDLKPLLALFEKSIKKLNQERAREGNELKKHLVKFLSKLESNTQKISLQAHPDEEAVRTRLLERLQKLGLKERVEPSRLAQEIIISLEKMDISEECQRVLAHIKELKQTLLNTDPVGKKMDFYTQELFREFNTMGSKTQLAELTRLVVESKVLVERIREQVQNIE